MSLYIESVTRAAKVTLGYADMLAKGITPDVAARKPFFETVGGLKVIDTNHPVFVYGHLGLYPARVLQMLGLDASGVASPGPWSDLFKAGVACLDDPRGVIYPGWSEVLTHHERAYGVLLQQISTVDEAVFAKPHPDERFRERFGNLGAAVNFMLNNHQMVHLGQVSAWRRCFGLPAAM